MFYGLIHDLYNFINKLVKRILTFVTDLRPVNIINSITRTNEKHM